MPATGGRHVRAVPVPRMRPGDFALGSAESRAAARALLESRTDNRERLDILIDIGVPPDDEPRIGEWEEGADGKLVRICVLPEDMTLQEAERIVAERGRARPPLKPEW